MGSLFGVRRLLALIVTTCLFTLGALPANAAGSPFTIEGRVIFPEGFDVADARDTYLLLMPPTGSDWIRASISADGRFSVTAPDSSLGYRLHFYDSSDALYDGHVSADGTVVAGNTPPARVFSSSASITVIPRLTSTIRGKIVLPSGTEGLSISSLWLLSYRQHGSSWVGSESLLGHEMEPSGEFELRGLDAGTTYRLELRHSGGILATGYYGAGGFVQRIADATDVVAPDSGLVIKPVVSSSLRGRVTVPTDVDLPALVRDGGINVKLAVAPPAETVFQENRRTSIAADGTFQIPDLWPGTEFLVGAWVSGVSLESGLVDEGGALTLDPEQARVAHAGATDANFTMRHTTQFSGTVELPDGFHYDPGSPPTIRQLVQREEPSYLRWSGAQSVPVGPDGSFTTPRAHSTSDFILELTWPDGAAVYWTSDETKPTSDAAKATVVGPRAGVVFPTSNRMKNQRPPSISGDARLGSTLRADGGSWSAPSATLRYQWLREGEPVVGATSATYAIDKDDVGSAVAVEVTARASGFTTLSARSAPTKPVAKLSTTLAATVLKGTSRSKLKLRLRVGTGGVLAEPSGTLRVTYGKTSRAVTLEAKHRGTVTVSVPRSRATGRLTVSFDPTLASGRFISAAKATSKITKITPKVKVKAPKKVATGKSARITVRVDAKPLTTAPRGKIELSYGSKTRTITLAAKHRGTVTVRLALSKAKGKHAVRARFIPHKKWTKFIKTASSARVQVRAR